MVSVRLLRRRMVVCAVFLLLNVGTVHAFTQPPATTLPFAFNGGNQQVFSTYSHTRPSTRIQTHRHRYSSVAAPTAFGGIKAASRLASRTKMQAVPSPQEITTLAETISQTALDTTIRELLKQLPAHYLPFYLLTKSAEILFFVVRPRLLALTEGRPYVPPTDYTFTWKCVVPNFANTKAIESASLGLFMNVGMAIWVAYDWQQSPPILFLVPSDVIASLGIHPTTFWSWSMFTLAEQSCWVLLFGQVFGQISDHGRRVYSELLNGGRRRDTLKEQSLLGGFVSVMIVVSTHFDDFFNPEFSSLSPTDVNVDSWQLLLAYNRMLPILFMGYRLFTLIDDILLFVVWPRLSDWMEGRSHTSTNYNIMQSWWWPPSIFAVNVRVGAVPSNLLFFYIFVNSLVGMAQQDFSILSGVAASFGDRPGAVTIWYISILLEQCFWVSMMWITVWANLSEVYVSLRNPTDRRDTLETLAFQTGKCVVGCVTLWIINKLLDQVFATLPL